MSVKQSDAGGGGGSGPTRIGSFVVHGKSSSLAQGCKSTLSEQSQRLSAKHSTELELVDDVRTFFKAKCSIEKDYCSALMKLCTSHLAKKYPQYEMETDSEIKSIYTAWQSYLEEEEKLSKFRAGQFEQIASVYDTMKHMKSHKVHIGKKGLDNYLKKMQEELIASVVEIDKNRKLYFDEEHLAKQARDKEEKVKKRKGGIFSKFTDLQSKKEKSSAHREASDIQSTMARNEYLLALAAGNAHFEHYYSIDLPNLMQFLEDEVLEKCKGFMLNLLQSETSSLNNANEALSQVTRVLESTSAEFTKKAFLGEPTSACLRDTLQFEFEPCDGDTQTTVSTEHNAELALQHEIAKWMTCFTKECRNLHRLNQQLTKCLNLQATGKKTVEVTGVGVVEIETRIDDIKQQLRKCDISKAKSEARLMAIKQSGMPIEDLEAVESQIASEMKQTMSLDVDVAQPLSRTPSLRSTNISEGRVSSMENKSFSDDQQEYNSQEPTPEPNERFSSEPENLESPVEKESSQAYNYEPYDPTTSWGGYDANEAWADPPQAEDTSGYVSEMPAGADTTATDEIQPAAAGYDEMAQPVAEHSEPVQVDTSQLVGRRVRALYPYQGQNSDELSFEVGQLLTVLSAEDADWVTAQNDKYEVGYIPAAFVEITGDDALPETNGYPESGPEESYQANSAAVTQSIPPVQVEDVSAAWSAFPAEPAAIPQAQVEIADEIEYVRALYDYTATSSEEISFKEGDIFRILEKSDDGWWLGEKDGVQGHFPSMLVQDLTEPDDEVEDQAFEESPGTESGESTEFPVSPAGPPPPSFAPPKPAYLTPHSVVIIQPTPEIESRGTFGSEQEDEPGITVDIPSKDSQENGCTEQEAPIEVKVAEFDADFSLDKPRKKSNSDEDETAEAERVEEEEEESFPPPPPMQESSPETDQETVHEFAGTMKNDDDDCNNNRRDSQLSCEANNQGENHSNGSNEETSNKQLPGSDDGPNQPLPPAPVDGDECDLK